MKKDLNCSGIYQIRNLVNGKVYVGSAVDIRHRRNCHFSDLRKNIHCNDYLQKSFNKYGEDKFIFEIIEIVKNKNKLIEKEQQWLNKTNCNNEQYGYNLCPIAGNSLGYKHTKESLKKMSKFQTGKPHRKGKKASEELKLRMSKNSYKFYNSDNGEQVKNKISNSLKAYFKTEKGKKAMKIHTKRMLENPIRKKGYNHTEKTKSIISNIQTLPVIQFDENNKLLKVWKSVIEASIFLNINKSGIYRCVKNKQDKVKKFKWQYFEEYLKN